MRRAAVLTAIVGWALGACASPDVAAPRATVTAPPPGTPPVTTGTTSMVGAIRIQPTSQTAVVGERLGVDVFAFTGAGAPMATTDLTLSLSDPGIATIRDTRQVPFVDAQSGVTLSYAHVDMAFRKEGSTTLIATLAGKTAAVSFRAAEALPTGALVVDTFAVLEARASCAWDCPYLVYWPVLKVREPSGARAVTVEAIEFTIPGRTTGLCYGTRVFLPGRSAHLNVFDPYLWSNDLIFVNLDGHAVEGDGATARILVREASGGLGMVVARTTIQRNVKNPALPLGDVSEGWSCQ